TNFKPGLQLSLLWGPAENQPVHTLDPHGRGRNGGNLGTSRDGTRSAGSGAPSRTQASKSATTSVGSGFPGGIFPSPRAAGRATTRARFTTRWRPIPGSITVVVF